VDSALLILVFGGSLVAVLLWLARHPSDDLPHRFEPPSMPPALPVAAEDFLATLDRTLELPELDRAEIRAELAAHLEDSIASIETEGLDEERATREALARLGSPEELARQLEAARRTTRRLLAGAAGGVFQAGVGAIRGYLAGTLALFLVWVFVATALKPAIDFAASHLPSIDQQGLASSSAIGGLLWIVAVFAAGRRSIRELARRSRWPARLVGRWWALAGFAFLGWLVLFENTAEQSWLVVPIELAIPVAFGAGALWRPDRDLPLARAQVRGSVAIVAIVGLVGLMLVGMEVGARGSSDDGYAYQYSTTAMDFVAPPTSESLARLSGETYGVSWLQSTWTVEDATALSLYHDLRFEAWRADRVPGAPDWVLDFLPDPRYATPYAVEPATLDGTELTASFEFDHSRTTRWAIFLTGVGPDGVRYRLGGLDAPESTTSTFCGTVWDWLTASD